MEVQATVGEDNNYCILFRVYHLIHNIALQAQQKVGRFDITL